MQVFNDSPMIRFPGIQSFPLQPAQIIVREITAMEFPGCWSGSKVTRMTSVPKRIASSSSNFAQAGILRRGFESSIEDANLGIGGILGFKSGCHKIRRLLIQFTGSDLSCRSTGWNWRKRWSETRSGKTAPAQRRHLPSPSKNPGLGDSTIVRTSSLHADHHNSWSLQWPFQRVCKIDHSEW